MIESSRDVNKLGCGLGLNISNKLVYKLSEKANPTGINIKSEVDIGSEFSFLVENRKELIIEFSLRSEDLENCYIED